MKITATFRILQRWAPVAIVAAALAIYSPTLHNFFVSEDLMQVMTTAKNMIGQFYPDRVAGYRPIMYVWWWLGAQVWGYQPFAFHWFIVVLHGVNGLLVFTIARRVAKRSIAGVIAVVLYLPVPAHADAINWLSAASNQVTCCFFYLTAVWLHLRQIRRPVLSLSLRLGTFIFVLLALATNEIALTLPLVLVGIELVGNVNPSLCLTLKATLIGTWHRLAPIILMWVVFVVFRSLAVHGIGGYGPGHLVVGDYLYKTGATHLKLLISPLGNNPTIFPFVDTLFSVPWQVFSFLGLVTVLFWPGRVGLIVFAAALLPVLNIPANHRIYITTSGLALAIGISASFLISLARGRLVRYLVGAILLLAALTASMAELQTLHDRNQAWIRAAQITEYVTQQTRVIYPTLPLNTVLYFYGLPPALNGAQVFRWGLPQSLQAAYADKTMRAFRVRKVPDPTFGLERSPEIIQQNAISETNQRFLIFNEQQTLLVPASREEFVRFVRDNDVAP